MGVPSSASVYKSELHSPHSSHYLKKTDLQILMHIHEKATTKKWYVTVQERHFHLETFVCVIIKHILGQVTTHTAVLTQY